MNPANVTGIDLSSAPDETAVMIVARDHFHALRVVAMLNLKRFARLDRRRLKREVRKAAGRYRL